MSHERCEACPVADSAAVCPGLAHRRYCEHAARELAEDKSYWRDRIVAKVMAPGSPRSDWPVRRPDGRVRVGLVTPGLHLGGAEWWLYWLTTGLDPARYRAEGCAVWYTGASAYDPGMLARFEAAMPVRFGDDAIASLWTHVDLVLCWGVPGERQRHDLKRPGCRSVVVSHGTEDWTRAAMASARLADAVVCVSRPSLDTIPESERARAVVIHNGVDAGRVRSSVPRAEVRAKWRIPPGAKVMGNVARVSEEKGTRAFAAALAHLPAEWHGVWIGPCNNNEAPRWAMLELAQSLGVVGRLHLPGPTDDVGSALGAIDSFVMPSTEDAHAFAGIEAILAGVPIVATPLGVVAEHPELFRVLPRDPSGAAVARAVLADSATPDETAARVESARTFARSEWSREAFLRRWDALFDSIDLSAPGGAKAVAQPHVPGAAIRPVAARAKGG